MYNVVYAVVSVCSSADIDVWRVVSQYVVKNIRASNYVVVVPDKDASWFIPVTHSIYHVMPESVLVGDAKQQIDKVLSEYSTARSGWYLQQLIKLSALSYFGQKGDVLIWDADTLPLRRLSFLDDSGRVRLYYGHEYHKPYFETIWRLIGLEKVFDHSFIAQCFYVKSGWVNSFFAAIEDRSKKKWRESILDAVDVIQSSSFSEYETLGTFIMSRFPDEITLNGSLWSRRGKFLVGDVSNVNKLWARMLLIPFDFVAFEKWDQGFDLQGVIPMIRSRFK